jgi:biotin carboxyl carrier protein
MKRTLTLRLDGEEFTVTVYRQGDSIVVERNGRPHVVQVVSEEMEYRPDEPAKPVARPPVADAAPAGSGQRAEPAVQQPAAAVSEGGTAVVAPMSGVVKEVLVAQGASVAAGDRLIVMEAMKMDIYVDAPLAGIVAAVSTQASTSVASGEVLLTITGGDAE